MGLAASGMAENGNEPISLEAIVVTAQKTEQTLQTGDVDTEETSAAVVVIEREAFEGKLEGLDTIIEKETGIQVRQYGGLGGYSSVALRGSTSDQVMIFLDGVLLNDANGGGVDLSTISLSDVASIEIYKGTSPLNFGKASIGGVVNIKTIRSKEGFNASAGIGYGSFNTWRANGFVNHKPGRFDYLISAEILSSDNDFEITNNKGTPLYDGDDTEESQNNAEFEQINLLGKTGYDLSDARRIEIFHQYFFKDQNLPNWKNDEDANTSFMTDRNISTLKYTHDGIAGLPMNLVTFVDFAFEKEEYDDSDGYFGLGYQHDKYYTTRYGGNAYLEWLSDYQTIGWTMDIHQETYESDDLLNDEDADTSRRLTFSAGLQDTIYLFDDRLRFSPALRYSQTQDDFTYLVDAFGMEKEDIKQTSEYWEPQIGVVYQPLVWLKVKSNLGRYYREPHFYELSGDRGYLIGNPDLEPEEGTNFDMGLAVDVRRRNPLLSRLSLQGTYFQNEVDNLISTTYDARGVGRAENIDGARIRGVEMELNAEGLKYFRLAAKATLQETENLDDDKAFNGKDLPGRWEEVYLGRLEAFHKGFKVFSEYIVSKGMYYTPANDHEAEDKKELNAGISWLRDHFLYSFEAKNILDKDYEDFRGWPMPGRSYFGSVTYKY